MPDDKRGLVISSPASIVGRSIKIRGGLDPQELRAWLLLWDKLVWPTTDAIHPRSSDDDEFLEHEGIIARPQTKIDSRGEFNPRVALLFFEAHLQAFKTLEQREPGLWALAQGEQSFLLDTGHLEQNRAFLVELSRAIPVPDKQAPLADILEFRTKRRPELLRLRAEVDKLYSSIDKSDDKHFELQRCARQLETACIDLVRTTRESLLPFRISSLKASFELKTDTTVTTLLGLLAGQQIGMPLLGTALGGAAGLMRVSMDVGIKGSHGDNPYWYVAAFHREIFGGPG